MIYVVLISTIVLFPYHIVIYVVLISVIVLILYHNSDIRSANICYCVISIS